MDDDRVLLAGWCEGSEPAFASLVQRYTDLVHAAASRRLGDPALVEDVVQSVFIVLARRAGSLGEEVILAGWLLRTLDHVVANLRRTEARRRMHEQRAARLQLDQRRRTGGAQSASIGPVLDSALAGLTPADRDAVVLRFLVGRSLRDVGRSLGISEDAAGMRVSRALAKLRSALTRLGVTTTDASLRASLPLLAAAAPLEFASRLPEQVLAGSSGSSLPSALADGAIRMMAWSRYGIPATIGAVALIAVTGMSLALLALAPRSLIGADASPPPAEHPVEVIAPDAAGGGGPVTASDEEPEPRFADDDLLLSPRQDLATLGRAWSAWVAVDYQDLPLRQVIADLGRRSGVDITVDDVVVDAIARSHSGAGRLSSRPGLTLANGYQRQRARFLHFLGADRLTEATMAEASCEYRQNRITFTASGPLPLPLVLEWLLDDGAISYRGDGIVIGTWRDLLPELAITRTFVLRHPWGSIHRDVFNGEPVTVRLNLLDTYALKLGESSSGDDQEFWAAARPVVRDPTGAYERLHALGRSIDVAFDPDGNRLTLTGAPAAIDTLGTCYLDEIDRPSPEASRETASRWALTAMARDASGAFAACPTELQAEIQARAAVFLGEDRPAGDAAGTRLRAIGVAALAPLLALTDATTVQGARTAGLAEDLYADRMLPLIRAEAEAYFAAVMAGDLAAVSREHWTPARQHDHRRTRQVFESELARALNDPSAAASFRKEHGLPPTADLARCDYDSSLMQQMHVDPRVEAIRLSGDRAEVRFSASIACRQLDSSVAHEREEDSCSLRLIDGRWLADRRRELTDQRPRQWRRPDQSATAAKQGSSTSRWADMTDDAREDGGASGAWEIAVNLGF